MQSAIATVESGQSLTADEMAAIVEHCMSGQADATQVAQLLVALHRKGETAAELVGAARAMRQFMTPIRSHRRPLIDTCGTGGSGSGVFNISTAAAIVAAAAGAVVAKHGNRKSTSQSGSADVLQVLGVNIECPVEVVERSLNEIGLGFCFAPLFHPSVKHVTAVRRSLPCPTIFNLLGPLCNPAGTEYQLLGAGRGETRDVLAAALAELGCARGLVVHGRDGLGEISHSTVTDATHIDHGRLRATTMQPQDFGIEPGALDPIRVNNPQESAALIRAVLAGQPGPAFDIVVINAAAALWIVGAAASLADARQSADDAIRSGRAAQTLDDLVRITNQPA